MRTGQRGHEITPAGFEGAGLGAWRWAAGSGVQAWGEDMNCPSKALGIPAWERRGIVLVRDLVVLVWESTESALGGLGMLGAPRMLRAGGLAQVREAEGAGDETSLGTAHSRLLIPMRKIEPGASQWCVVGGQGTTASMETGEDLAGCKDSSDTGCPVGLNRLCPWSFSRLD